MRPVGTRQRQWLQLTEQPRKSRWTNQNPKSKPLIKEIMKKTEIIECTRDEFYQALSDGVNLKLGIKVAVQDWQLLGDKRILSFTSEEAATHADDKLWPSEAIMPTLTADPRIDGTEPLTQEI